MPNLEMWESWIRARSRLDGLLEGLFHLRVVLAVHHVDEVDDDEPPEVAQAELAGDLLRRLHVRLEGGFLDVPLAGSPGRN